MWLPTAVEERLIRERQDFDAEVGLLLQHDCEEAEFWTRELRQIDPYLEVRYVPKPPAWPDDIEPPEFGMVWHRWHVIRRNPGAPDSFWVIQGDGGEYRGPDSGVLELVKKHDMGSERSRADRRRRERVEQRAREAQRNRDREALRDEFAERIKARLNPSVSMSGSWTARAGARKG